MKALLFGFVLLFLSGCSAIDMKAYRDNQPQLDLFEYFSGETQGWGIVQNRKGELTRQFVVDIHGTINDKGQLILEEDFIWNDGEETTRTWLLTKDDQHSFSGTAQDVVDRASGVLYGNVLNWKYRLLLNVDGTDWQVTFDDWMFQVSDELLLNRAVMSKFGIQLGEVTIVFKKPTP